MTTNLNPFGPSPEMPPEDSPAEGAPEGARPFALTGVVPASADGHHVLAEYHTYAAIALVCGASAAHEETGAPLAVHAARLAAALDDVLTELAVLRVIAAGVPL